MAKKQKKKLKNYLMFENYTLEVSINAFTQKEAEERFDSIISEIKQHGAKVANGDFALNVHNGTYNICEYDIN